MKELNVCTIATKDNVEALFNQEQTHKVMKWVAPNRVDPDESYKSALRLRQKETGKWFLTSSQFDDFLAGKAAFFGFMEPVRLLQILVEH